MVEMFPRMDVGGLSLSRLVIGSNWFTGGSHKTRAVDWMINEVNGSREAVSKIIQVFLAQGVDTLIGGVSRFPALQDGIRQAEDATGKRVFRIDLTMPNMDDTPEGRAEAANAFDRSRAARVDICLPLHSSVEQLVNKNKKQIERIGDYLYMIRERGMIPGLSSHEPEIIQYADTNQYDVETYVQPYNSLGFLMQKEVEIVHRVIWEAKKPVIIIKALGAGRMTPFVGLNFVWNTIREKDLVSVGCLTHYEAAEDIEISLAALQRRMPRTHLRSSFSDADAGQVPKKNDSDIKLKDSKNFNAIKIERK